MTVSRRTFMGGVAAGAAATALVSCTAGGGSGGDRARSGEGVVVLVGLLGGNDGLNTVVPAHDGRYRDVRGGLALDTGGLLRIGEGFALAPQLKELKKLWDAEHLAVVHGVGYPEPRLSHFDSMAVWYTADPKAHEHTGWVGRWLDRQKRHDPLRAVSVGEALSPALLGGTESGASVPVGAFGVDADDAVVRAWRAAGAVTGTQGLAGAAAQAITDVGVIERRLAGTSTAGGGRSAGAGAAGGGAAGALAGQMERIRALLDADLGTRVFTATLGGFDTHSDQAGTQPRLLEQVDGAVGAFLSDLAGGKGAKKARVTLVIWSEFGRRVGQNGSGTDHGTANVLFVAGEGVKGGHYGEPPSLTELDDDGNLRMTTDFRCVYATLLGGVLGADAGDVLAGRFRSLGFLG